MILAIDGYEANVLDRVGIGRYAYEILRHLYALLAQNSELRTQSSFRIYVPNKPLPDMPPETSWWRYRLAKPRRFWTWWGLPLALRFDRPTPEVIFSPTHYLPRFTSIPRVMAIMDLSYLYYPELFRAKDLHQLVHWTAYSVRRAAKIVTISEFSKRAIIKAYGVPEERVVVAYPGLSRQKVEVKMKNDKKIKEKYHISAHYILSVGTIQPRKNYVRLIEAFSYAFNTLVSQYPDLSLIIVGKKGWLYEEILASPAKFGVADRVKFLDFVPDEDLPELYKKALCFVLPSLYEGFGLPVLEAMSYGCPVVVSNTSSLPEIAAQAGIYVDPTNVVSIVDGIKLALSETGKARSERVALGKKLAKEFTWGKAAEKVLEVLEEVGSRR